MEDNNIQSSPQSTAIAKAADNMTHKLSNSIIIHNKASTIKMKPIDWLWVYRIARGKISIIAGDPGLGKSQVISYMAATISKGKKWHDGTPCPSGKVIILSAEDGNADTLVPRLHAVGADVNQIHIINSIERSGGKGSDKPLNLSSDIKALEDLVNELGNVTAIFIDPITGYMGDVDDHKNTKVRSAFLGLAKLAEKYNIAVVCVSHNNKSETAKALLRVIGSIAYVATARAVFVVIEDDAVKGKRLFLPVKNNIGNDQTGFAFSIEKHKIGKNIETSRVSWSDETVTKTADEVLRFQQLPIKQTARGQGKIFLNELLANGPLLVSNIIKESEAAGFSFRTIERAKDELSVISKKDGDNGEWRWHLTSPKIE